MSLNIEIGTRLKFLREKIGKTQKDIAGVLGVTPAAYGKIEAGDRGLSSEYCIQLADYFGVTCDFLLRGISAENVDICARTGLDQKTISVLENSRLQLEKSDELVQPWKESLKSRLINLLIQSPEFLDELVMDTLSYCISLKANFRGFVFNFSDEGDEGTVQRPQPEILALWTENSLNATRFSANEKFGKFYANICSNLELIGEYSHLSEEEKEFYIRMGLFKSE